MSERFLVKIEDMAFRGYGVARIEGKVVFVPFSATGDEAWVEIEEEKKSYAIGRLKEIALPSPWRVQPPCPYFGLCGGCQWQHVDYSFHGEIKKRILEDILQRLGKVKETPAITVVPSPGPYEYRARIQLKVQRDRIGYYRVRSHELVEIDRCLIAHPLINRIIPSVKAEISGFPPVEGFEINVSPEEGKGVLMLHVSSHLPRQRSFVESLLRSDSDLKGLVVVGEKGSTLYGNPFLHFAVSSLHAGGSKPLKLRSSPGSFFQVHPDQNQRLVETVLEFAEVKRGERVLDLYSGIGNLTLPLATRTAEVWGIEENATAVEDARFNAAFNSLEGCAFIHGPVERHLPQWERGRLDVIVLDPPRAGCIRIMERIVDLKPGRIIYVSCDPAKFARDIRLFSQKGFELRRLTLIDMFPQSYHMEVVGLLTKGSPFQMTHSR